MDFKKLSKSREAERPTDPINIFERIPNLPGTPNNLWCRQAEALPEWNEARAQNDVLISLYAGTDKTFSDLLVAQSLVNDVGAGEPASDTTNAIRSWRKQRLQTEGA